MCASITAQVPPTVPFEPSEMAASIGLRRVHTVAGDFALPRPDWPSGLKCILVDLSPSETGEQQREACAAQLRQCAYDVTCASTVDQALEALARGSFDVLLADAAALTSSKDDRLRKFVKELPTIMICECPRPEEVSARPLVGSARRHPGTKRQISVRAIRWARAEPAARATRGRRAVAQQAT